LDGKGRLVGAGTRPKKRQAASAVKKPALCEGALFPVIAKHGKVLAGEPSAVMDNKRMHVAVGAVVIVDRGHKLERMA
jgi:hypothetical protein